MSEQVGNQNIGFLMTRLNFTELREHLCTHKAFAVDQALRFFFFMLYSAKHENYLAYKYVKMPTVVGILTLMRIIND